MIDSATLCSCGKQHLDPVEHCIIQKGALDLLPEYAKRYQATRAFLLADPNTWPLAGERIRSGLMLAGIGVNSYVFSESRPEPEEKTVGAAVMHFDRRCDLVIAIGSGVVNDVGKILSALAGVPYFIVGTAPSMDGYGSATSSMSMDGLKVTLPSRCPNVIFGDTDLLKTAPDHMLRSGLGDMLAKYVSICEWRISHLINGEYYCEEIAAYIREALQKCIRAADGLLRREEESLAAVMEGLVACGRAMAFAGLSRPASGIEHYFSHIWDMRGLEFGLPVELHGIQCAVGTMMAVKLYHKLASIKPDREKALAAAKAFDFEQWSEELRRLLGKGAEAMIAQEAKEQKYALDRHEARLEVILSHWEDILSIMKEELPPMEELEKLLCSIGAPCTPEEIGVDPATLPVTFRATKDIRDKYVLSRLAWDLGVEAELAGEI